VRPDGRGGYFFFIKDNVLHFHTPDYQAGVWAVSYYDVPGTALKISDTSQEPARWSAGVEGARLVTYDPATGHAAEVNSNPAQALRFADYLYQFQNIANGQKIVPFHVSYNPPQESRAMAQFYYQRARQGVFRCSVSLAKTIMIRHGDLLNLSIVQQPGAASSQSGLYYVTGACHIVKKQVIDSTYTLERGEFRGVDQSTAVQNTQGRLVPASTAPGVLPNLGAVRASNLTAGAGQQSSATTYTAVTDANTGEIEA
jgi:hypothetical protein